MPPALASREYKLMLRAAGFAGSEAALTAQVAAFWRDFSDAVAGHGIVTDGAFIRSKERPVTFYDTADRHLNNKDVLFRDYVFRVRSRADGTAKVTLKYRHPDRLVAGDRDLTATKKLLKKREIKFERDIKPVQRRMRSLYSYSGSGRTKDTLSVDTVGDIVALFPDLGKQLDVTLDEPVAPVSGFTARDLVLEGGRISLSGQQVAECAVVIWYDRSANPTTPVVAEFSFRHPRKHATDPRFTATEARVACRAFHAALDLDDWAATTQQTKTAYVYAMS
jgi:hypothetical protein